MGLLGGAIVSVAFRAWVVFRLSLLNRLFWLWEEVCGLATAAFFHGPKALVFCYFSYCLVFCMVDGAMEYRVLIDYGDLAGFMVVFSSIISV